MRLAYMTLRNWEDAKDVSQEAFIKIYRSVGNYKGEAKFSTWFYRIVMNTAKDCLRKRRWKSFLGMKSSEEKTSFLEHIKDPGAGADQTTLGWELGEKISDAISGLPERQKQIFNLRFIEHLSMVEISDTMGIAVGTVKATLHFAVQKFSKELSPYMKESDLS